MLSTTHSETHVLISICTPQKAYPRFHDAILSTKYSDDESELAYYGYRYYSPELGRWVSRDPVHELGFSTHGFRIRSKPTGGSNGLRASAAYLFVHNDPIALVDLIGLEITDPPPELGFTLDDVHSIIIAAIRCGIKGPGGVSMALIYQELLLSRYEVSWVLSEEGEGPSHRTGPGAYGEGQDDGADATIFVPAIEVGSCQENIPMADTESTSIMAYGEVAILHELMHAYQAVTGTMPGSEDQQEAMPIDIGNRLRDCINCMGGQLFEE